MWAGRPLGWGPSSATTMLGTERAKSVLSVHPCPRCPWESEKAGPWGGGGNELSSNVLGMHAQGAMQSRVTPGPGGASLSRPPGAPPLQGGCPLIPGPPAAGPGRPAASQAALGGCGHQHICHPRRLAHAHPHGEGQCPAAFRSTGPDPGSCHAQQLHLLPHGPQKTRAAVGTDGCPSPPPPLQRWRLRGRPNFQPRSGPGVGGSWPLIPKLLLWTKCMCPHPPNSC